MSMHQLSAITSNKSANNNTMKAFKYNFGSIFSRLIYINEQVIGSKIGCQLVDIVASHLPSIMSVIGIPY